MSNRPFLFFWLGQAISQLGDEIYLIALVWQAMALTQSTLVQGTIFLAGAIPRLVFILLGGVLSDRLNRLRIMMWSDLVRGLLVMAVAYLSWQDQLVIGHLYLFALLFGMADAFFEPASASVLPGLVRSSQITRANSLLSITAQVNWILGALLGGVAVAAYGPWSGFLIDGVTFGVSILSLAVVPLLRPAIHGMQESREGPRRVALWADLKEGLSYVSRHPYLRAVVVAVALVNLGLNGPSAFALPNWVRDALFLGPAAHGLLRAASGVGAILAGIIVAFNPPVKWRGRWVFFAVTGVGLVWGSFVLFAQIRLLAVVFGLLGVFMTIMTTIGTSVTQSVTEGRLMGRVMGVFQFARYGTAPLSYALTGFLAGVIQLEWLFAGAGVIIVAAGIGSLFTLAGQQQ